MGWAKYSEDNEEIISDRWRLKSEKADYEYKDWMADIKRASEIIQVHSHAKRESEKKRLRELYEIKENLQYKMNLVLVLASGCESYSVKMVTLSLNNGVEESYSKINKIIQLMDENSTFSYVSILDKEHIKNSLIKNICFKMEQVVNQAEVITQDDMESIKDDIKRIIAWFYKKEVNIGRLSNCVIDEEKLELFICNELESGFCSCPVCGKKTIKNLKFCIECAREW